MLNNQHNHHCIFNLSLGVCYSFNWRLSFFNEKFRWLKKPWNLKNHCLFVHCHLKIIFFNRCILYLKKVCVSNWRFSFIINHFPKFVADEISLHVRKVVVSTLTFQSIKILSKMEFQNSIFTFLISSRDKKTQTNKQKILNLPQEINILEYFSSSTWYLRFPMSLLMSSP